MSKRDYQRFRKIPFIPVSALKGEQLWLTGQREMGRGPQADKRC